ncbi:MAG: hypothetical protein ABEL51_10990 [Salinibacter sp.]
MSDQQEEGNAESVSSSASCAQAEHTPGPAYADGRYVVANPDGARPNGGVIMSPSGYGNDLPGAEQRANAQLAAAAFNAAEEVKEMGYDPQKSIEAVPVLLDVSESFIGALRSLDSHYDGGFRPELNALQELISDLSAKNEGEA